jgi:HTH-type transcriptional regulator/antitoxin HigA
VTVSPAAMIRQAAVPPTLGSLLRQTLTALDISQAELARRTGLTTKHVNWVVNGRAPLSVDVAIAIGHATGIPAQVWAGIDAARRAWEITQAEAVLGTDPTPTTDQTGT